MLGGVLEYLTDPGDVVAWLSRHVSTFVVSYEPAADGPRGRIREAASRARAGWVSSLTESALRAMFADQGFDGSGSVWWDGPDGPGRVFRFSRASSRP